MKIKKSPIYYVGNKTKLIKWLVKFFPDPKTYDCFYEIFGGSGVVGLNVEKPKDKKFYNELRPEIVEIYKMLKNENNNILDRSIKTIKQFGLNKENKENYLIYRDFVISTKDENKAFHHWLISHFSFSNMTTFSDGKLSKLSSAFGKREFKEKLASSKMQDFKDNFSENVTNKSYLNVEIKPNSFVYVDPPYYLTDAVYMRELGDWTMKNEEELLDYLILLNKRKIKWMFSNLSNDHLLLWSKKHNFKIFSKQSTHVLCSYQKKKTNKTKEIIIINY